MDLIIFEATSTFDDSITERKIKDRNDNTENDPDDSEFDGDNVRLKVDQKSYKEQSNSGDNDNVIKKSKRQKKS